ncbi:TerD family protein [Klenkia sp. PcliD-1-E]|uniref:TerD family protein n=1 Tax=Klenkia sp. PcliD-1-E TaxID=2954492 RepID=UPI0020985E93|nr:TerD family protein [Klenkia sp. PcliD-1-E]MCO7219376.1 TerD family protein [Klenkia sp. PcliD-1-E]
MNRGANVALTREIPGLTRVAVGASWNAGSERVLDENLVLALLLCGPDSRVLSGEHVVFFNQLTSPDEAVAVRDRALGGDQEQVEVDLQRVPADVSRLVAVLYVNEGTTQRRTLGQLRSVSVVVRDGYNHRELVRSEDLAPVLQAETALVLGEVYRHGGDWKFKVVGEGYRTGIAGIAADYGLPL